MDFNYNTTKISVTNNGHTVQVNYDPGSVLTIDGSAYDVAQFHFHAVRGQVIWDRWGPDLGEGSAHLVG